MPLRDHFHSPDAGRWPWASLHGAWIVLMAQQLNQKVLPAGYQALNQFHLGGQGQVDVATVHQEREVGGTDSGNGAIATAVWAPPQPPLVVPADLADLDVFEIQVFNHEPATRLVAAVELVSPANKNRPDHRQAFAAKCAAYLQQEIGVVVIDVVTERRMNMHGELMDLLGLGEAAAGPTVFDLYAVAYRARSEPPLQMEMWPHALTVGAALPTLPLWIGPALAVPLDLEASYLMACDSLQNRR